MSDLKTLVVGGNGKTGSRVLARLRARAIPALGVSRSSTPAFDWERPDGWQAVLHGVGAVYLTYQPDLAAPGAAERVQAFVQLAVQRGVRRIVLLSGRGEQGVLPSERAVRESGAEFTILRAAFFAQNFSEGALLGSVLEGQVPFPAGGAAEPFIDVEDVADVAVAALTDARHAGQIYELSGPRLLTFADAAAEISRVVGREVVYQPVSGADYKRALAPYAPAELVGFLVDLFEELLDGHNAYLSDGVQRVLGRAPRDFSQFARAAAAAWQV